MKNLLLSAALLLSFFSSLAHSNMGVAFVHGTGKQTDALNKYWTKEFVNSVSKGLPNSALYTVINCDFEQYMWNAGASGCLAEQLTQFIDNKTITNLQVITHSNGGNVVRWILSNPTSDARFPKVINKISRVIALAPSSGGTPLADAVTAGNTFEQVLGWILGYDNDAVKQQQVADMALYNANWLYGTKGRPSLGKPFEVVVGSDVDSAIWDSDSYCAGYQYQVALEFTQNWLDSCSDGFLNCASQSAAGSVWFKDKDKTKGREPLSHQQSRRACFKLDTLIRDRI